MKEEQPEIKLTEEDIRQAKLVHAMRLHPGFPVLVEFWNAQREAIIRDGKLATKRDPALGGNYWMELSGFDKACGIIEKIAARTESQTEIEKLEEEGNNLAQQ